MDLKEHFAFVIPASSLLWNIESLGKFMISAALPWYPGALRQR